MLRPWRGWLLLAYPAFLAVALFAAWFVGNFVWAGLDAIGLQFLPEYNRTTYEWPEHIWLIGYGFLGFVVGWACFCFWWAWYAEWHSWRFEVARLKRERQTPRSAR